MQHIRPQLCVHYDQSLWLSASQKPRYGNRQIVRRVGIGYSPTTVRQKQRLNPLSAGWRHIRHDHRMA